MKIYELLNKSFKCLQKENELDLAIIYKLSLTKNRFPQYKKKGIFGHSILKKLFSGLNYIFSSITFFSQSNKKSCQIYAFSSSENQLSSMATTLKSIKLKKMNLYLTTLNNNSSIKKPPVKSYRVVYSFKILLVGLVLFLFKGITLFKKLKKIKKKSYNFSFFFYYLIQIYLFIPYFIDLLSKLNPKIVLMSNDHSISNRCLRFVSEMHQVKTIYMQHASVSIDYPPLEFDYAFLDGVKAYETYAKCSKNIKNLKKNTLKNIRKCKIFLTGVKKNIYLPTPLKNNRKQIIGIATSVADNFDYVYNLLNCLREFNIRCIIRTHPNQSEVFAKKLKIFVKQSSNFTQSNAKSETISAFFGKINIFIGSNTNMHLEAAMCNLPTFYYKFNNLKGSSNDYGFLKSGLSIKLLKKFDHNYFKKKIKLINFSQRKKIIKNFSETYNTYWQNKEGELSTIIIDRILNNLQFSDLFKTHNSKIFHSINKLKQKKL